MFTLHLVRHIVDLSCNSQRLMHEHLQYAYSRAAPGLYLRLVDIVQDLGS